uniref:ATP synthase subunit a n=1 Tax=Chlamydosaurus kingii TaxID=103699 RepID=A4KVX4_CHLKI|nr:ATP synthase F0 subunit 6 [Chlamydosaurus kingii]ABK53969.1 ATPase subunit 6 [Chlamydosaurus kingii]ABK53982.1 ATPase subunit 6 [Chlamydosaurus kingii]ABK53995.1 ATPase subunit 6 [Chlamydosaurus kingii]
MMTNLFTQFSIPTIMGLSLLPITLFYPLMLINLSQKRLKSSRLITLTSWLTKNIIKYLMPTSTSPTHKWTPILTSLILLILTINILGMLPYTFTPTTQLSLTLSLALPLWLGTVLTGLRTQPTKTMAHLLPLGTPIPLIPILIVVETISLIIRPLALGVRLTANLTAGHLLLQLISTTSLTTTMIFPSLTLMPTITLMLFTILEIAVAMIQAYVFTLLLILYLQENS